MNVLGFACGGLLVFLAGSGVSMVLARGHGSFAVLAVISLVAALLLALGFGLGAALARRAPPPRLALALGGACALASLALLWLASAAGADPAQSWLLLLALPLLGAAVPVFHGRRGMLQP